mmetsp:Transcript_7263/g.30897  ORF Transcript_7263/g.30897 Transcript_7263/m.30897 type:complete len:220 (-) Transcript_7263:120-779(-)
MPPRRARHLFLTEGESCRRAVKYAKGRANATPMLLPHMRWRYSQKKMPLNSSTVMCGCMRRNSGNCLYLANSSSHASLPMGGREPESFQSTIERPDSVRRVTPPIVMMPNTMPVQPVIHNFTARGTPPAALPPAAAADEDAAAVAVVVLGRSCCPRALPRGCRWPSLHARCRTAARGCLRATAAVPRDTVETTRAPPAAAKAAPVLGAAWAPTAVQALE